MKGVNNNNNLYELYRKNHAQKRLDRPLRTE